MSDLRPMVVMVCDSCAEGSISGDYVRGCAICNAQALVQGAPSDFMLPPKPVRSREGMVEAGAMELAGLPACYCPDTQDGHSRGCPAHGDLGEWPESRHRSTATRILNAAIPGLLDPT